LEELTHPGEFWFSSKAMTVWVRTGSTGIVTDTAPVTRKFVGQPVGHLADWMRRQGGFRSSPLTTDTSTTST
jgi:hypothetical protein